MKLAFEIIYEDNHMLVVNKPAGMLVQGDKTGDQCLLEYAKEYIKKRYNKPGSVFLGLVHRLDRPVSGIVIMAKTSKALQRLNDEFRSRNVKKYYWAITDAKPPEDIGHLENWLIKDKDKNIVKAYNKDRKGAIKAELDYEMIGRIGGNYLISIRLITGRFHQIRVQMASIGCSIVGDLKYGSTKKVKGGGIYLHAREIGIIHPVKKEEITFIAKTPTDTLWQNFDQL